MNFQKNSENSRIIAILLALCLALTAQFLFTGEVFTHQLDSSTWNWTPRYSLALALLLLAIGCAGWATFLATEADPDVVSSAPVGANEFKENRQWVIFATGCYVLSLILYSLTGENSPVQWLWVAGAGFLAIPLWLKIRGRRSDDPIPNWDWVLVGVITLIGFGLRYWKLTEIPSHVDNDVALMGSYGLKLINSGQYNWIGFSDSEHLLSYDQFLAWCMRLFGQNHYGIVMGSVILGTLSLPLIFLLGREMGGRLVGFVAIGLLTISYTHIQFSRILFGNSGSFIAIFATYAFFKGLRSREPFWFALAGLLVGWGLLLYDSSRVIPLIIISAVAWLWLWQRQSFKATSSNLGLMIIGIFISFGPMLVYALRNFTNFSGRANSVLLWVPNVWQHELASYNTSSPLEVYWQQIWRTFLTLHLTGDGSPHFAFQRPMVDSLTAALFILGAGYCLIKIKNIKYFTIISWIVLTFILGGVLTADPPYWPHLNIALPAIVLVAAFGAKSLANTFSIAIGNTGYKITSYVLVGVILFTGFNNWQIYYNYVQNNAGNRIRISRYLSSLPNDYYVYLSSPDWSWNEFAFRFFNQKMSGQDLQPETLGINPPVIEQPAVFILFKNPEMVPVLERVYPAGIVEYHLDYNDMVSFVSYRVVPPGYTFKPVPEPPNPLALPGWWLIFATIFAGAGRIAFLGYKSHYK